MKAVTNTSSLFKSLNNSAQLTGAQTFKKSDILNNNVQNEGNHKNHASVNDTDVQKSHNNKNTQGVHNNNDVKNTQHTAKTQHSDKSSEVYNVQEENKTQGVSQKQSFDINDTVDISDKTMNLLQGFMDLLGQLLDSSQKDEDTEDLLGMLQDILDQLGGGEQVAPPPSMGGEFEFFNQNDQEQEQEQAFYADENTSKEDKVQHFQMRRAIRAYGA